MTGDPLHPDGKRRGKKVSVEKGEFERKRMEEKLSTCWCCLTLAGSRTPQILAENFENTGPYT